MIAGPGARPSFEVNVLVAVVMVHVGFLSASAGTDSAQYLCRRLFQDADHLGFLVPGFTSYGAGNDQVAMMRGLEFITGDS